MWKNNLDEAMKDDRRTNIWLSDILGVSDQTISNWKHSGQKLTEASIIAINTYLPGDVKQWEVLDEQP